VTDEHASGSCSPPNENRVGWGSHFRGGAKGGPARPGHATQPGTDRDEYPPAVTKQGGVGASVRNIPSSDNRGAGASVGQQIRDVPNGGKIRIIPKPKPKP
jgi:hypothetical protein